MQLRRSKLRMMRAWTTTETPGRREEPTVHSTVAHELTQDIGCVRNIK
jgi:hypothetical protein